VLASESPQWKQKFTNATVDAGRIGSTITLVNSTLILFGGFILGLSKLPLEDDVAILNVERKPWTWEHPTVRTPGPRLSSHTSVELNGLLVVFGGVEVYSDSGVEPKNDTWTFDPSSLQWKRLDCRGDIPSPRCGHQAANHGSDFMYVFGGSNAVMGQPLSDLYVFKLSGKSS